MKKKLLKIALIGKTNAGKSTLINSLIGKKISIINKKINTTQDLIIGIKNTKETQIIFYDTPGFNILKQTKLINKKFRTIIWESIENVDCIIYLLDVLKYDYSNIIFDLKKISKINKPIFVVFNKMDLIDNKIILPYIKKLNDLKIAESFFNISAKNKKGINRLLEYLKIKAKSQKWIFNEKIKSNKDNIFFSNECTRNAILKFIHKELPYKIFVSNDQFMILKNNEIKIKQSINLENSRHKSIFLGNKGRTIKKIRENSQKEISKFMKRKIHLYLKIISSND